MASRMLLIAEGTPRGDAGGYARALDAFEGPLFTLVRDVAERSEWPEDVHVCILTTDFGIVPAGASIPAPRRKMTDARAADAIYENFGRFVGMLAEIRPEAVLIAMPSVYRRAVLRKEVPYVQNTPAYYVDASKDEAVNEVLAWIKEPG
jgi:hypothetical protein